MHRPLSVLSMSPRGEAAVALAAVCVALLLHPSTPSAPSPTPSPAQPDHVLALEGRHVACHAIPFWSDVFKQYVCVDEAEYHQIFDKWIEFCTVLPPHENVTFTNMSWDFEAYSGLAPIKGCPTDSCPSVCSARATVLLASGWVGLLLVLLLKACIQLSRQRALFKCDARESHRDGGGVSTIRAEI